MAKNDVMNPFPDLMVTDEESEVEVTKTKTPAGGASDQELAQLRADLAAERAARQSERATLISTPLVTVEPKFDTTLSLDDLPDPVAEDAAFKQALAAKISTYATNVVAKTNHEAQRAQSAADKANGLWSDFSEAYPEYAEKKIIVGAMAQAVIDNARRKGVNTDTYMFGHSTQFMKDVVDMYDREVGKPKKRGTAEDADDEEEIRTVGVFGGLESGGKPNKGRKDDAPKSMFVDVTDWQKKHGFY